MILIDNRNILRVKNRDLLNRMIQIEKEEPTGNVLIEQAKTGVPTLNVMVNAKRQYIHSKYDPIKDAERFIDKHQEDNSKHVLFIGVGLGYHIKRFTEVYPSTTFSIYEPDEEILLAYLSHSKMEDLPLQNLYRIFTGANMDVIENDIQQILQQSQGMLQVISLPVCEKMYDKQIANITKQIVEALKHKRLTIGVNASFQKRWTINSIKNFPTVLSTPNILHDIERSAFEGKPAIIVAAGPSLNEEFENIRYIKENGLAYIFCVGSAINALIENGIYPDAACTYDPQDINQRVIQIIKDKQITSIPLIFGTSVGFETLENYPGKMLHMLVSQDTIAPALLGNNLTTDLDYVNDAPSIAVVTYQLLSQLGCSKIILVGQNLAFIGEQYYANGIDYGKGTKASELSLQKAFSIKDVDGNDVKTSEGFNKMRQQLEMYIKSRPEIVTINTTKGGAAIEGTIFTPLQQVIKGYLTTRQVTELWDYAICGYNKKIVASNLVLLQQHQRNVEKLLKQTMEILGKLNQKIERRTVANIEVLYGKFDQAFVQIKENYFYRSFIEPMIRVQNEQLAERISTVRYEREPIKKGTVVVEAFHRFIHEISAHHVLATELFEELKVEFEKITETNSGG